MKTIIAATLLVGVGAVLSRPEADRVMGSFASSLQGRTPGQKRNARLAAQRVDGIRLELGATFSFNRAVGPWTPDRGYVVAPVSYEGEMIADWGGGVCQTSTALYNAGLLAGLTIVERHRHTWPPTYAPPGLDATVTERTLDLKLGNPYPFPVRIRSRTDARRIAFDIVGRESGPMDRVWGEEAAGADPIEVVRADDRFVGRRLLFRGRPGIRVAVYRVRRTGPRSGARELVSEDSYPAMNRVLAVGSDRGSVSP